MFLSSMNAGILLWLFTLRIIHQNKQKLLSLSWQLRWWGRCCVLENADAGTAELWTLVWVAFVEEGYLLWVSILCEGRQNICFESCNNNDSGVARIIQQGLMCLLFLTPEFDTPVRIVFICSANNFTADTSCPEKERRGTGRYRVTSDVCNVKPV